MALKLIGADGTSTTQNAASYFYLAKFTAEVSWDMTQFKVYSVVAGNVKCALYADNAGEPGILITAMNIGQAVVANQWNTLTFTPTPIVNGTVYWLAFCIDTAGAITRTATGVDRYKAATYSTFTFPDPAGTGFTSNTRQHLVAGWTPDLTKMIFYPDPDPEIVCCDSSVARTQADLTWGELRNGAGSSASPSGNYSYISITSGYLVQDTWRTLIRFLALFDTRLLPVKPIVDARLSVVMHDAGDGLGCGGKVAVFASSPISDTDIVKEDYQNIGSTVLSEKLALSAFSLNTRTQLKLNSLGIAAIVIGGITKLGLRESEFDAANIAPPWVSQKSWLLEVYTRDYNLGYSPWLEVIYNEAAVPPVGEAGHYWVETTKWHFLDENGAEVATEGVATGNTGVAGHYWVEGNYFHYIDANGDERRILGTQEGAVGKISGHVWVEGTKFRYIDLSGNERYF